MQIKYKVANYFSFFSHTAIGIRFDVWLRLIWRHSFRIGWVFWPKAFFITAAAFANLPFSLLEQLLFARKIAETKVESPIFIVGYPRSGTTFLQYVLSKDTNMAFCTTTDALAPNIMLTLGNYLSKVLSGLMPKTRPQDNIPLGALTPKEEEFAMANISLLSMASGYYFPSDIEDVFNENVLFGDAGNAKKWQEKFHFLLQKLTLKHGKKRLIVKSPMNTGRMKEIMELCPDAVFIHIHRHPYQVYQSNLKLYKSILPLLSFQKANGGQLQRFILESYPKAYQKFFNDCKLVRQDALIELSYEDFVADPKKEIERVYGALGLGSFSAVEMYFDEALKSFSGYQKNIHPDISLQEKHDIDAKWDFFFKQYRYSKGN